MRELHVTGGACILQNWTPSEERKGIRMLTDTSLQTHKSFSIADTEVLDLGASETVIGHFNLGSTIDDGELQNSNCFE